jgi:hypothetical protein
LIYNREASLKETQGKYMRSQDKIPYTLLFIPSPYGPWEPKILYSRSARRNKQSHGWARADVKTCGNNELPSIEEVVVVAGHLIKAADTQRQ